MSMRNSCSMEWWASDVAPRTILQIPENPSFRDPSDHLDNLRITNPPQVRHAKILKVDEAILCPEWTWESDESDNDRRSRTDSTKREELVRAVEEGLITPSSSEVADKDSAFAAYPPLHIVGQSRTSNQLWNDDFLGPPLGTSNGNMGWDIREFPACWYWISVPRSRGPPLLRKEFEGAQHELTWTPSLSWLRRMNLLSMRHMSRELRLELEYNASENLKEKEKGGGEPRHI
jgi:hypothetical protein